MDFQPVGGLAYSRLHTAGVKTASGHTAGCIQHNGCAYSRCSYSRCAYSRLHTAGAHSAGAHTAGAHTAGVLTAGAQHIPHPTSPSCDLSLSLSSLPKPSAQHSGWIPRGEGGSFRRLTEGDAWSEMRMKSGSETQDQPGRSCPACCFQGD